MKRYILGLLATFCILGFGATAQPQDGKSKDEIQVLFIGNSLTYYHDLPKTREAGLARSVMSL